MEMSGRTSSGRPIFGSRSSGRRPRSCGRHPSSSDDDDHDSPVSTTVAATTATNGRTTVMQGEGECSGDDCLIEQNASDMLVELCEKIA